MTKRTLGLAAMIAALALGGCGESLSRDTSQVVADLPALLVPDAPEVVTNVACPEVVPTPALDGAETEPAPVTNVVCSASLGGEPIQISLAVSADDTVSAELDVRLMRTSVVAEQIAERLTADLNIETSVTCEGWPVVIHRVGRTFNCLATDPGGVTRTFVATVVSDDGQFELAFVG